MEEKLLICVFNNQTKYVKPIKTDFVEVMVLKKFWLDLVSSDWSVVVVLFCFPVCQDAGWLCTLSLPFVLSSFYLNKKKKNHRGNFNSSMLCSDFCLSGGKIKNSKEKNVLYVLYRCAVRKVQIFKVGQKLLLIWKSFQSCEKFLQQVNVKKVRQECVVVRMAGVKVEKQKWNIFKTPDPVQEKQLKSDQTWHPHARREHFSQKEVTWCAHRYQDECFSFTAVFFFYLGQALKSVSMFLQLCQCCQGFIKCY